MFKTVFPFYIVCFVLYVFFTRQPDYMDGEFTNGVIHYVQDGTNKKTSKVYFKVDTISYTTQAAYLFRSLKENENVQVIYDTSNPDNAAVYTWWGYWIKWDEILASIFFTALIYFGANAITKSPSPESLIEELENTEPVKTKKYN